MKKIESIIRPYKLEELHTVLQENGFSGTTVSEVRGYGRQKGHKEIYRGLEYNLEFVLKVKVELDCEAEKSEKVISLTLQTCQTGEIGDGKIFISPVEEVIRIRTGETGNAAL